MGVSHHQKEPMFATCGELCQVWEEDRNEPIRTFQWGVDSLHDVSFNPIETHLLGKCMCTAKWDISRALVKQGCSKAVFRCSFKCWVAVLAFLLKLIMSDIGGI